ncbi:hypothetical protein EON64_04700 [archaeon]|nr:MAG: hypothetical protein EON64_04700 [archaeon]
MEELRALLDLAKLDAASARKLAIAIRAALPNGTADKGGEAAQAISSGAGVTTSAAPSPSRKKPRLGTVAASVDLSLHPSYLLFPSHANCLPVHLLRLEG